MTKNKGGPLDSSFRRIGRVWLKTARSVTNSLAAILDLAIRLSLAQSFFVSGLLKATNWDSALYLAAHEYPVTWLAPTTAAYLGVSIELICPVFLAFGLFTRVAAVPMLILSLVIQFSYRTLDINLFWAALLGWLVIFGAGALSLDSRLARGLGNSALFGASRAIQIGSTLRRLGGPAYHLALRLWLGAALVGIALRPSFFPVTTAQEFPNLIAVGCGLLLVFGLLTPVASAVLIVTALGRAMMGAAEIESFYALAAFTLIGHFTSRSLSLDYLISRSIEGRLKPAANLDQLETWPHIVIVGAGFGGLACAIKLRWLPVRITLIDRRNYHLFQPLLYQVATAGLSPGDIATPIRSVFRDAPNVNVLWKSVSGIDTAGQAVVVQNQRIHYDYLVLATGASHSYFGRDQWAPFAPGLKRLEDATDVRGRILSAFEKADAAGQASERVPLLTFLIVGGGPTGVELAGAIAELAHHGFEKEFRGFDPKTARIVLIQSASRILPAFPEKLSAIAKRSLESLGVEVMLNSRVEAIDSEGAIVSGSKIAAATVLWAAGVVSSPAAQWLGAEADSAGRVKVTGDLSVPGLPNVFAIGDTAAANSWKGNLVPGLAPAAKQGGEYVAKVLRRRLMENKAPEAFRYRHRGSLATIGRKSAVADFGRIELSGATAWWLWGLVHVYLLVGLRNRLSIVFDWFWAYATYSVGTRLITGDDGGAAKMTATIVHKDI